MLADCLLIIAIAFGTALAGEGITWLLVYRSDQYKRLKPYKVMIIHTCNDNHEKKKTAIHSGEYYPKIKNRGEFFYENDVPSDEWRFHLYCGVKLDWNVEVLYSTSDDVSNNYHDIFHVVGNSSIFFTRKFEKVAEMDKKTKKLEKKKQEVGDSADKNTKKKLEREEERLKATNRDMSMFKMKSMFAIGLAFTALLSTFNSIFEGRVVAKLPFHPIGFIQGLSHRNLIGDDMTDCSFIFLYILCTMTVRQNLQKILGFAPSRAMARQQSNNPWAPQQSQMNYLR